MRKLLLLIISLLLVATTAMADDIGIYTDATGTSCELAPGFTQTPTVIHKFSAGATGSSFSITLPPGSSLFGLNPAYSCGISEDPYSFYYCECLTGSIVVGTIIAILAPGTAQVVPAPGSPSVMVVDCSNGGYAATGGSASVGGAFDCPPGAATESATWGKVKALYR